MMKINALLFAVLLAACGGGPKPDPDVPVQNPPAAGAIECEKEIALVCPAGQADGCGAGLTSFHVCVTEGETAGPPCEQEIAKVCPEGQSDACLATPRLAATHLCVVAPAGNAVE